MESIFLEMITPRTPQLSLWGVFHLVIVFSALLVAAECEPCLITGGVRSDLTQEVYVPLLSLENACPNPNLFCFPSTLSVGGVSVKSDTGPVPLNGLGGTIARMSDSGNFRLSGGGRSVSCSLNYQEDDNHLPCYQQPGSSGKDSISSCSRPLGDNFENLKTKQVDDTIGLKFSDGSLPEIEVSPHLLDWGENFLYFPSLASVMVVNSHKHSILYVFEPYSTNSQFYPCNSSEVVLAPGEAASICFVFLPTSLGLASAQLVLQTNYGGFLVQAKGFAVDSPYGIRPFILDSSSGGRWIKNFSLFNPFNETLYVEEVISWASVSLGNGSHLTKTACSINNAEGSSELSLLNAKEWLSIRNSEVGLSLVAVRPHGNWVVGPQRSEPIMELDFSWDSEGKFFGALSMRLLRSSQKNTDTVIIPLEVEMTKNPSHDEHRNIVSLSLATVMPCSYGGTIFLALSVHNDSPQVLKIIKITEEGDNSKQFRVKYMEGLILFPHTVTQVALVSYCLADVLLFDLPSQSPEIDVNCKIIVSTNGSRNSQVEIPCTDIFTICIRENLEPSAPPAQQLSEEADSVNNSWAWVTEADEAILMNWKSQATASDLSVLDKHEVVFPVIEAGHFCSEWITVKNPSQQPVLMQLILNSAEIIDECGAPDRHLQASFVGNNSVVPTRYGFSVDNNAVTEALVHPFEVASLGPVWFRPGSQCRWKSSALIRNNLSGLEWVSLGGLGGSLLMVLLEESEPIQSLDFKINLPSDLNSSFPGTQKTIGCSQLLTKEVYAKNTGDLPLRVIGIGISGTKCQLDGFSVDSCKGFSLAPGESKKMVVSYQTDFSVATIQRDFELALSNGILVIPMKATLPMYMLALCKRTFVARLRKSLLTMLLVAFLLFLVTTQLRKPIISLAVGSQVDQSCAATRKSLVHSYGDSKTAKSPIGQEKQSLVPSDTQETTQTGNLRVKVGNEKGRRRRKKKGSGGVTGVFDVSSSHSGNSTPSPSSPVSNSTPKQPWPRSPFLQVPKCENRTQTEPLSKREFHKVKLSNEKPPLTTQEKPTVKLPSATPISYVTPSSPCANSRAPGSRLHGRKEVKSEEMKGRDERFVIYDIWGDHLFGLGLPLTKDVLPVTMPAPDIQDNSYSFFVRGPQILMTNSRQNVVSCSDHDG